MGNTKSSTARNEQSPYRNDFIQDLDEDSRHKLTNIDPAQTIQEIMRKTLNKPVKKSAMLGNPKTKFNSCKINIDTRVKEFNAGDDISLKANKETSNSQVIKAKRLNFIKSLKAIVWENKEVEECCICMDEFEQGDEYKRLPCKHFYHAECIDDWLLRSFDCPSCREPVDAALISCFVKQILQ